MHIVFKVSQSLAQRLFYVTLEWAEPRKYMAVNHDKMRELIFGIKTWLIILSEVPKSLTAMNHEILNTEVISWVSSEKISPCLIFPCNF